MYSNNYTVIAVAAALVILIVAIVMRKRIGSIKLFGAQIQSTDPSKLSAITNLDIKGNEVDIDASGKGSSIDGVKIDQSSSGVRIKASTK